MYATAIQSQAFNMSGCFAQALLKNNTIDSAEIIAETDYRSLSTNVLVKLCSRSPQHPAWDEFYRRFDKFIRLYVGTTCQWYFSHNNSSYSCSYETRLELTQEVYIKLLDDNQYALRRFVGDNDNSFLSYLARIAKNVVIEHFRKQQANKRKGNLVSIEHLQENSGEKCTGSQQHLQYLSSNPEPELVNSINSSQLYLILEKSLSGSNSRRDLIVLKLYLINGMSLQEINDYLDLKLKISSVESIINRTMTKLRKLLAA